MPRLPVSLVFIPVLLIVYLLAWIPGIDALLLKAMLRFWPIAIVNGGLIALAVEVYRRKFSKLWLLLPAAWFVGYAVMAVMDRMALSGLRTEIKSHNSGISVPFQPSQQHLYYATGKQDDSLIQNYGLNVVYSADVNKAGGYIATRMINHDLCNQAPDRHGPAAGIYTYRFREESEVMGTGALETRYCMLTIAEAPNTPLLTVTITEKEATYQRLPVTYIDRIITLPQAANASESAPDSDQTLTPEYKLRDGHAAPLAWLPMPIIDYNPETGLKPVFALRRNYYTHLNTDAGPLTSGTVTLARALGLKRMPATARKAEESAATLARIDGNHAALLIDEAARLDKVLGNIQAEVGNEPFNNLQGKPEVVLPRLDGIISAIEAGIAERSTGRGNAQQLFRLLDKVPGERLEPYRSRFEMVATQDVWFQVSPERYAPSKPAPTPGQAPK